jgi:uncharacterized phiE125 gp8 family phage protein
MYGGNSGRKIKYSIVTDGPAVEPIDRTTVVASGLKLGDQELEDDEALLDLLIQASREDIEHKTGKSFITQTRQIKLDYFPNCDFIELTNGPVQEEGIEVTYFDADDAEQTLDPALYWVDTHSPIARIVIKNSWPETKQRPNAVTVEYVAGYGDEASDVPAGLRSACLIGVGWLYENRDQPVPFDLVDALIGPYVTVQDVSY